MAVSVESSAAEAGPLDNLVTMRMIALFNLMRREGVLARRRQFGLSENEWRIMAYLGQSVPLSLSGLADLLMQDCGQLSRAVKGLVERGLLSRERRPGGPEIEIALTAEGRRLYERLVERVKTRDRALTAGIPPEDIEVLWRVMGTMTDRASALLEHERELG